MEGELFVRKATGLRRELGWFFVLSMPLNNLVGIWIAMYGMLATLQAPGGDVVLATFLAWIPILIGAVGLALLSAAIPRSGGTYIWETRLLHPIFGGWGFPSSILLTVIAIGMMGVIAPQFIGMLLVMTGIRSGITSLIDVGSLISADLLVQLVIGALLIIGGTLVNIFGVKWIKAANYIIFIGSWAGTILMLIVLAAATPQSVMATWDATWGQGAYQEIVNLAGNTGWTFVPVTWEGTMSAMVVVYWAYVGMSIVPAMGGEISAPKKSFMIGIIAAALLLGFYYISFMWLVFSRYGDFVSQYTWVMLAGVESVKPSVNVELFPLAITLALSATDSVLIQSIIMVSQILMIVAIFPALIPGITREVFAMSFDRMLPRSFANVHSKYRSPYVAAIFVGIASLLGLLFYGYAGFIAGAIGGTMLFALGDMLRGFQLISIPFFREDIWRAGYAWTIKGFPVDSIVGLLVYMIPGWLMIFLTGTLMEPLGSFLNALVFALGMIVFIIFLWKNKKEGHDMAKLYSEIPPA